VYSVPGFSLAHEMRSMVQAGVPTYAVLESATKNPAAFFGREAEFGTVEVGKRADLILVEANPLEDIRNVHRQAGVMVRGRWFVEGRNPAEARRDRWEMAVAQRRVPAHAAASAVRWPSGTLQSQRRRLTRISLSPERETRN